MAIDKMPHINSPCKDCPFRVDCLPRWLGLERITEILESDTFVCHKKTDKQCSGHMLLLKQDNSYFRLASRLSIDLKLKNETVIFKTKEDCKKHHT